MSTLSFILIFSALSGILSMIGGVVLLGKHTWVKKFSIHFISFATGTLLAAAFLDLIPEAFELTKNTQKLSFFILAGILVFFVFERFIHRFHIHSHENDETETHEHATPVLIAAGDAIHNFVDGAILASAFLIDPRLGVIAALSIAAHELPQEISDFAIMLHHGWSRAKVFWINLGVSLTNVMGAVLIYLARGFIEPYLPFILAFTAGSFIYIATADLIPQLSISKKARDKLSHVLILVFLGIASVWYVGDTFGHGHSHEDERGNHETQENTMLHEESYHEHETGENDHGHGHDSFDSIEEEHEHPH